MTTLSLPFFGVYRDDDDIVFEGYQSPDTDSFQGWLHNFKTRVNKISRGDKIQLTMDIWKPGQVTRALVTRKIKVCGYPTFVYLDMEMFHDDNKNISLGVFTKTNCKSKYLNNGTSHPKACKKAVTRGVSICLAGLTTRPAQNEKKSLSKL